MVQGPGSTLSWLAVSYCKITEKSSETPCHLLFQISCACTTCSSNCKSYSRKNENDPRFPSPDSWRCQITPIPSIACQKLLLQRIIESLMLKKTTKIISSNHQSITTTTFTKPGPSVPQTSTDHRQFNSKQLISKKIVTEHFSLHPI